MAHMVNVVALLRACVEKRGGTTGVLNRRAGDKRGKREREVRLRASKETQGLGSSTQKARKDIETVKDTNVNICVLTNDKKTTECTNRLQPNRPANRCRCLFVCAPKGIGWRCCRKHTGVPRSSASLPKTCREETMENGRGEASPFRSDSTSSSISRDPPHRASPSLL